MRKLVLAALLGASLAVSARADAYKCTAVPNSNPVLSQAWNQRCIPYWISTNGSLLDGEERRLLIAQSFAVWSTPSCTDLTFMDFGYTDQAPGFDSRRNDNQNIIISIETEAQAQEIFTRNELAITITSFNTATGEIFDADLMINAARFPFEDVKNELACHATVPPPYDLRNTIVHEIGHVIGFEHDDDEESTMFASAPECEVKKRDLTQDNIKGVCDVYGVGQPTMTCAPPDTYDQGPGDPNDFRDQCNPNKDAGGGGCACTHTAQRDASVCWISLIGALFIARRRLSGR